MTERSLFICLFLGLALVLSSVYGFAISFHNFDMGWNFRHISSELGVEITDKGSDGVLRSPEEMISLGYSQLRLNFLFSILGSFVFGSYFIMLYGEKRGNRK